MRIKINKLCLFFVVYVVATLLLVHLASAQTFIQGPALIEGVTSTATAAGTTTLTKNSQTVQTFTGVANQFVVLPDATTIPVGRYFYITNRSTGTLLIDDAGANQLATVLPNMQIYVVSKSNGSANGSWDVSNIKINLGSLDSIVPLTPLLPVKTAADGTLTTGLIDLTLDVSGILPVANGGTGLDGSAAANGSLLIGNGTGYSLSTLTGTANRVTVTNGAGTITLSGPQDIATSSSPTFAGLTLSGLGLGIVHSSSGGVMSSSPVVLTSEVSGILPLANGGSNKNMTAVNGGIVWTDADSQEVTAAGTSNQVLISNGAAAPSWSSVSTLLDTTYFKQGGNSFTAAARLGTNDSNVLEFETNNTLVGTFSTGGLLAIGTAAPTASAKLDIQGTNGALLHARLTTTQKNALTPTNGMQVYDSTLNQMQCYINGSWSQCVQDLQSSDLTLTASDTLAISLTHAQQTWLIQGNSGPITMATVPFGSTDPVNGAEIILIGNTDADSVTFVVNDAANGIIGYGFTLGKGMVATVKYNATLDRYVVKSISN